MSSTSSDSFTSFLFNWVFFISFFFLLTPVARTFITILNKMAQVGVLVLLLILKGMLSTFHH